MRSIEVYEIKKNRGACGNGGGAKNKLKVQEVRKKRKPKTVTHTGGVDSVK